MGAVVLDYSQGFPGAAAIKAAGYAGAVRYIGFPDRRKCTTAAELADFTDHGLGMALVYQDGTGDWTAGHAGGRAAAHRARAHATQIGFPRDRPIYLAIDRDIVTETQFAQVVSYLRGAALELGGPALVGVYGEHDVCARAARAGAATWFWQCRAWSGTPPHMFGDRHLYQRAGTVTVAGIPCDVNDVEHEDWGQHNRKGDDVSYDDAYRAIRDYMEQEVRNPREDNTTAKTTSLRTQILFNDWRRVRLVRWLEAEFARLRDNDAEAAAAAAAAYEQLRESLAEIDVEPISPAEHARALAETLPPAVVAAFRELITNPTQDADGPAASAHGEG